MVKSKSILSDQNHFGPPKLFWSHRRTRHYVVYWWKFSWITLKFLEHKCLVLLCDQNSFGWSKMVLVWPNWFGLDHNDLVSTKMKWSRPKWIGQVQMWFILVENHNLDLTNSFWSWPFHFGRDQIIMVKSKSIWSDQNHFGPTKTVLVT